MKIKNIIIVLLVAFIPASCAPAVTVIPTETIVPTSTFTPAPPTVTSTPAPENIADSQNLQNWIDDYFHAFGGNAIVNNVEMNTEQFWDEIKSNPEKYTKTVKVNDVEYLFLVVNETPLAIMGSDNVWRDVGYKDITPQRMSIGSSFAIWTGDYDDGPRYKRIFAQNFNLVATDGSLSEYDLLRNIPNDAELTPQQAIDLYDWTDFDKIAEYARQNKLPLRAMHLFNSPVVDMNTPQWLEKMSDEQLREYIKLHIASVLSRVQFHEASVANEAFYGAGIPGNSFFYSRLGESYIEIAFQTAHELSPDTILILNDNIVYGGQGQGSDDGVWTNAILNGESNAIFNFVKKEISKGVPINGVGIESHLVASDFVSTNSDDTINKYTTDLTELFGKYQEIGMDVYITELDVNIAGLPEDWSSLQKQDLKAKIYGAVFEACLYSENCKSVTTWGFSDTATWMLTTGYPFGVGESPLPLDLNYRPFPASYTIKQVLFEYWLNP
jgi:GH35 family endo-1,4-beta-xylanase